MSEKDLVRLVTSTFEGLGVRYFITGGMAAIAYGEPRYTSDIDVVADIPHSKIPGLLAAFPHPEFYLSEPAVRDAIARRFQFNILHPASSLKVDVILPGDNEYDSLRLARRVRLNIDLEKMGWFATPEDVILKKLIYFKEGGSEKHLRDIAAMLLIQADAIDRNYLEEWANKLGVVAEWRMVCERLRENQRPQLPD